MSARLLGLAFDAECPTASAKLVLIKLVDCCDDEGRKIFPALATLARAAQCDRRTVMRHLALFCTVGLLRRVRDGGAGRGSTTQYEMNLDVLRRIAREGWQAVAGECVAADDADCDADTDEAVAAGAGSSAIKTVAEGYAENAEPRADENGKGDTMSPYRQPLRVTPETVKGDTGVTQPLNRNPQEEERERVHGNAHGSATPGHAADASQGQPEADGQPLPRLPDFVKAWPTSTTDSAARVEAAWGALSLADRREAIRRVPDFLAELKRQKRSHVPAGFTYLSERKWQALPAMKQANDSAASESVKPYSKAWWALFHKARGVRFGKASLMLSWAEQGRAWFATGAEIAEAKPEALKAMPAQGDVAQAFLNEARRAGFHFPRFGESAWIFLPEFFAEHANNSAAAIDQLHQAGGLP